MSVQFIFKIYGYAERTMCEICCVNILICYRISSLHYFFCFLVGIVDIILADRGVESVFLQ